jgi:hypothetical protein
MVAMVLQAQDAAPVRVSLPEEKGLSQQLRLSGSLTAQQDAGLSSRTAGLSGKCRPAAVVQQFVL